MSCFGFSPEWSPTQGRGCWWFIWERVRQRKRGSGQEGKPVSGCMHELVICGQLGFSLQEGTLCSITWNVSPTGRWEVGDWPPAPGTLLCKTLRQEGRETPGTLDVGRLAVCRELPITALHGNHGARGCHVVGHSHQPLRARAPPGNRASPSSHREAGTGPLLSLRHTFSFEHWLIGYQLWAGFIWSVQRGTPGLVLTPLLPGPPGHLSILHCYPTAGLPIFPIGCESLQDEEPHLLHLCPPSP